MVEVGNNSIIIRNIDKNSDQYKKIKSRFSVYDPVVHKYTFSAFYEVNDDLFLPASIGISEIQKIITDTDIVYNSPSPARSKSIQYNMVHEPRDDLQKSAINFLMGLKNRKEKELFLSLATGKGKTYIITNIAQKLQKRAFIIVDTLSLAEQWKNQFLFHTDLTENDIAILSGSESVEKEIVLSNKKVYICIHRTLSNMLDTDINLVNTLMKKLGIGLRVFDEAHTNFGNICKINSFSNVLYTIYLSATPARSKFSDDNLYGKVFRKIPYFNGKDQESERYHTVILTSFRSHPDITTQYKIKTKYGFNTARWSKYIVENEPDVICNNLISIIKELQLIKRNKKTAVIFPTLDLIRIAKQALEQEFPDVQIGTFIGEIKSEEERQNQLSKQIILTNDKIFDKAIDVPDLEVLISYIQLSSTVKLTQIIGRLRYKKGKSAVMVDVSDTGFNETLRLGKIRKRFYKKYAKQIFEK